MKGIFISVFVVVISVVVSCVAQADPWADYTVEFTQTIGQHVGVPSLSDPGRALGAPVGGGTRVPDNTSLVSLGQGGHITLGFDEPVWNDPANTMGLDFIVFGNAFWGYSIYNWQEPGYVEIAQDLNGNGQYDAGIDSPFYLMLPNILPTDLVPTQIIGWTGTYGDTGESNTFLKGYADNNPTLLLGDTDGDNVIDDPGMLAENFYTVASDPDLVREITPGSGGGDAFDIEWAVVVDHYENTTAYIPDGVPGGEAGPVTVLGQPVPEIDPLTGDWLKADIDYFDFIRIVDGHPQDWQGVFGDIDTEIDAVAGISFYTTPVPSPATFMLLISGLLGIVGLRKKSGSFKKA